MFSLDIVELVSQGKVVLVSLLDFENLSLELGDEEVFLVALGLELVVEDGVVSCHDSELQNKINYSKSWILPYKFYLFSDCYGA